MKKITREDILSLEEFALLRAEKKQAMIALKKNRRLSLGPYVTIYFENYDTMWWQIHEMLRIEKGGEEQITDELLAYNPMIPQGNELIATVMIEIDDPEERLEFLSKLAGFEDSIVIRFGEHVLRSEPIDNDNRTTDEGKTSSVHFLRWRFTAAQAEAFSQKGTDVIVEIAHQNHTAKALMDEAVREVLVGDLVINLE